MSLLDAIWQCFLVPAPLLTEENLPNQAGRVFIVTGGYAGVGKELCKILYQHNGTIYVAGRSQAKADKAIAEIKAAHGSSDGRLEFLHLDLADLPTIKASADEFLRKEQRLDVLTNNAGVMNPPAGSKTAQQHELQMGTNCLGPFLFTRFLTPLLEKTAASSQPGSVRVTWAASIATYGSPTGGVEFGVDGAPKLHNIGMSNYAQSKAGNVLLSRQYMKHHGGSGIVSNSWNPGNLATELGRYQGFLEKIITRLMVYPSVFGAYTELWAGWGEEPGLEANRGKYIGPWSRFVGLRKDVDENEEGAKRLWEWCDKETQQYTS